MPIYKSTLNTNNSNKNKKPEKIKPVKQPMSKEKKLKIFAGCMIVFCLASFVLLMFKNFIRSFYLGTFGIFSYPLFLTSCLFFIAMLSKKKYTLNKRYLISLSFALFFVLVIIHLILTHKISTASYGSYLVDSYKIKTSGGGIILSLLTYPVVKYLTVVGAYIFNIIGLVISIWLVVDSIIVARNTPPVPEKSNFNFTEFKTLNEDTNDVSVTFAHKQEDLKKKIAKQKLGLERNESTIISSSMHIDNISEKLPKSRPMSKREYILTPPEIVIPDYKYEKPFQSIKQPAANDVIVDDTHEFDDAKVIEGKDISSINNLNNISSALPQNSYDTSRTDTTEKDEHKNSFEINDNNSNYAQEQSKSLDIFDALDRSNEEENSQDTSHNEENNQYTFDDNNNDEYDDSNDADGSQNEDIDNSEEYTIDTKPNNTIELKEETNQPKQFEQNFNIPFGSNVNSKEIRPIPNFNANMPTLTKEIAEEEKSNPLGRPKKHHAPYVRPPVDLLNYIDNPEVVTDEECQDNIDKLEKVLEDFKIPAKVKAVQVGPAVTRYEIGMPTGISVKKVQLHADDIAMVLASNGGIRIEAPIPGKNAVGIEVPNKNITAVSMREMIESLDYQKRVNPMSFVLGKDINGTIQFCNLDKMPHLLVAGSTGSGKSVCLNTMLISMLYKSSPEDVRLILIDPKTVEFSVYANLPHLLTPHIITTKEQAINALNWAIKEMEYRYSLLQQNEVVNIKDYNNLPIVKDGEVEKLPYIVIVIDELNDLMIDTKREMEERIMKLAQKSRAAGIHLVIATQRPSVDVITGTIKANLPSRIAFALTNFADSKTVLDMGGAEKLLGRGDMLFKPNDMPEPRRVQGAYISSQEVSAVVKFIKANNPSDYDDDTTNAISAEPQKEVNNTGNAQHETFDPIMKDALRWFISANQASITMIQRRFGVGYARAARIIDQMEQSGFITPQDGSKPRQVLISLDDYNAMFN